MNSQRRALRPPRRAWSPPPGSPAAALAGMSPVAERFRTRPEDAPSDAARRLPQGSVPWKFFTPLIWAPMFPFLRMVSNRAPRTRPYLIGGGIALANLHGFWLISNPDLSDEALDVEPKHWRPREDYSR